MPCFALHASHPFSCTLVMPCSCHTMLCMPCVYREPPTFCLITRICLLNRSFYAAITTLDIPEHCRAVTNKDNQMKKANAVKSMKIQADFHQAFTSWSGKWGKYVGNNAMPPEADLPMLFNHSQGLISCFKGTWTLFPCHAYYGILF